MWAPGFFEVIAVFLQLTGLASHQEIVNALRSCRVLQCRGFAIIEYHDAKPGANDVGAIVCFPWLLRWIRRLRLAGIIQIWHDTVQSSNAIRAEILVEVLKNEDGPVIRHSLEGVDRYPGVQR